MSTEDDTGLELVEWAQSLKQDKGSPKTYHIKAGDDVVCTARSPGEGWQWTACKIMAPDERIREPMEATCAKCLERSL